MWVISLGIHKEDNCIVVSVALFENLYNNLLINQQEDWLKKKSKI